MYECMDFLFLQTVRYNKNTLKTKGDIKVKRTYYLKNEVHPCVMERLISGYAKHFVSSCASNVLFFSLHVQY